MSQGKVKWFNNAKGYGFIIEDGDSEDLFAHFSAIRMEGYKTLKAGERVSFDKEPSSKGTHAVNIVPLDRPVSQPDSTHDADHGESQQKESRRPEERSSADTGAQASNSHSAEGSSSRLQTIMTG